MATQPKMRLTEQEYLAIERKADFKSEFYAGEMFAMAGASERHNMIVTNASSELRRQLKGRSCRNYSNDMRVCVEATGLCTYPDVVAICGEARFLDNSGDTLINPGIIIEVLSPSTEADDRGAKAWHYRQISSLTEYLLIAQDKHHVEHYVRQADGQWLMSESVRLEDVLQLPSINCELAMAEIYDKIEFGAEENTNAH